MNRLVFLTLLFILVAPALAYADYDEEEEKRILASKKLTPEANAIKLCDWTTMTLAVVKGELEQVRQLTEAGADIQAVDKHGRSLLSLSKVYERKEVAEFLSAHGAQEKASNLSQFAPKQDAWIREYPWKSPLISSKTEDSSIIRESPYTSTTQVNVPIADEASSLTWKIRCESTEIGDHPHANYYFRLSDSFDWVFLGNLHQFGTSTKSGGMCGLEAGWVIPGLLVSVSWSEMGFGMISSSRGDHCLLILYEGKRVRHVYQVEEINHYCHAGNRPESSNETLSMEWDANRKRLVCRKHAVNYPFRDNFVIYPDLFNYYRFTEDGLELAEWGTVEFGVDQPPVVLVAERNGMRMDEFLKLNPEMRGKVFCDQPVIGRLGANTSPEWIRKDLERLRKPGDDAGGEYEY
jgi:hypothetical protein